MRCPKDPATDQGKVGDQVNGFAIRDNEGLNQVAGTKSCINTLIQFSPLARPPIPHSYYLLHPKYSSYPESKGSLTPGSSSFGLSLLPDGKLTEEPCLRQLILNDENISKKKAI